MPNIVTGEPLRHDNLQRIADGRRIPLREDVEVAFGNTAHLDLFSVRVMDVRL